MSNIMWDVNALSFAKINLSGQIFAIEYCFLLKQPRPSLRHLAQSFGGEILGTICKFTAPQDEYTLQVEAKALSVEIVFL
ncbi:hypothetical protein V5799_003144 [Amblyomma americanum]|uniref:Uncharacterized protein n=1 Tax=Amblyomma americanum TaxID=6943 RepID=A0AAQ4D9T5_AMBAM